MFGLLLYACQQGHCATPPTMRLVEAKGACTAPFTQCVDVVTVPVHTPKHGEALIEVMTSSVNPSDRDTVEGGGCVHGCGADISGRVVACPACSRLKVGDDVWTLGSPAYAEYVVVSESRVGLKPSTLDFLPAGTIPEVGLTSWLSLKRSASKFPSPLPAGSPWPATKYPNLTVAITAGSGGTGFIAIEMAKAWGAKHILTSTTGAAGFSFVRSLGATWVSDYVRRRRPVTPGRTWK
jgi:NADPH:quinone reductase-like Zn-dependent oxidoreductase